ncbi:MAG: hypothetical protein ACI4R9_00805 [Kiritimatiellia bacterium]
MKMATVLAALWGLAAWAAEPVAVWDREFSSDTLNGVYGLKLNGNEIVDGAVRITGESGGMTITNCNLSTAMVLVRYTNLVWSSTSLKVPIITHKATNNSNYNLVGIALDSSGATYGVWTGAAWGNAGSAFTARPDDAEAQATYDNTERFYAACFESVKTSGDCGTKCFFRDGFATASQVYYASGLRSSGTGNAITDITIGGLYGDTTSDTLDRAATGMCITGIAIFDTWLTADEVTAYRFPSEINTYTTQTPVNGTVDWSTIDFDHSWTSSGTAIANIVLDGDAVITLPADFTAYRIAFTGEYDVTLKSAGAQWSQQIMALESVGQVVCEIPQSASENLTIPAGRTFRIVGAADESATNIYSQVFTVNGVLQTSGTVKLSGANVISGADAKLQVTDGTTLFASADRGLSNSGQIVIDKGATLVALTTDTGHYNSSGWKVAVSGTLDMANKRWTIMGTNTSLDLYGGAIVKGAGDANGAIDLHSKINLYADAANEAKSADIDAPIKWSDASAVIWVAQGMTLNLNTSPTAGVQKFTKQGLGKLCVKANQNITGAVEISAGTLELAGGNLVTGAGTITLATDTTLAISSGDYDLTSKYTVNGSLAVTGGSATVDARAAYPISVTSPGVLKAVVTDEQWASGTTLPENFTVDGDVIFVHDSVEVTGSGTTLAAQGITWTGGTQGNWSDSANWSGGKVPTAADVAILATADAVITLAEDDVAAGITISANTTIAGTIGSDGIGSVTIKNGATLTVAATGALAGVASDGESAGTLVKTGDGELAVSANADGYAFDNVAVDIQAGTIDNTEGRYRNVSIAVAAGTTIKRNGWITGEGSLTLSCDEEVSVFANTGSENNLVLTGFDSITKQGEGTMIALCSVQGNTAVTIAAGTLKFVAEVNGFSSAVTFAGDGKLELSAATEIPAASVSGLDAANWPTTGVLNCGTTVPTDSTVLAKFADSTIWQGTVVFENKTDFSNFNPNGYGNASSTVRLKGCAGYFAAAKTEPYLTIQPTVELVNGSNSAGFKVTNGTSGDRIQFNRLTGSGVYWMAKPNGAPTHRHFFPGLADFRGSFKMDTAGNRGTLVLGHEMDDYTATEHDGTIIVDGMATNHVSIVNSIGAIKVMSGAELVLAGSSAELSAPIVGEGVVSASNFLPSQAVRTAMTNTATTVAFHLKNYTWNDWQFEQLSNPNSLLRLTGIAGYGPNNRTGRCDATVELVDEGDTKALKQTNGYSSGPATYTFRKIVGTGTLTAALTTQKPQIRIEDASEFAGTFAIGNTLRLAIGGRNEAGDDGDVEDAANGQICVFAGAVAGVAKPWSAGSGLLVKGTLRVIAATDDFAINTTFEDGAGLDFAALETLSFTGTLTVPEGTTIGVTIDEAAEYPQTKEVVRLPLVRWTTAPVGNFALADSVTLPKPWIFKSLSNGCDLRKCIGTVVIVR